MESFDVIIAQPRTKRIFHKSNAFWASGGNRISETRRGASSWNELAFRASQAREHNQSGAAILAARTPWQKAPQREISQLLSPAGAS